jgi:hypothetical protein
MKKSILFLSALVIFINAAQSQSAWEGKMEQKKGDKVAAVIELPYSQEVVEDAIKEYQAQRGAKQDKTKGFQVFRGVKLMDADPELNDLYFKVDKKNGKEKNASVVYLTVGKPGEDITLRAVDDRYKISEGINFLNQMVPSVESYILSMDIGNQEEMVKKAEKKLKSLEDEEDDLEKRIKNLQDKLEENRKDQQKQSEEIMKQKTEYEALKAKRRG